jgi:hypothetical protein
MIINTNREIIIVAVRCVFHFGKIAAETVSGNCEPVCKNGVAGKSISSLFPVSVIFSIFAGATAPLRSSSIGLIKR